jgi:multidrug resistance efflux pump
MTFHGRIVPTNATELRAPQNVFRVAGWTSESSSIDLIELAAENEAVTKGAVVARFRFRHARAKTYVDERLRQAAAAAEKEGIELDVKLQQLRASRDGLELAAARARVDTLKATAISQRQLQLYRIDHEIAAFEASAAARQLAAFERRAAAERDYHRRARARAGADLQRYFRNKARYHLVAPHDGIVRYAYNSQQHRKVRKGDGMNAGAAVLSIARDDALSVRFFVPEHQLASVRVGDEVAVLAVAAETIHRARVSRIERFPQEMGFLRQDADLPNAREKAYVARASFVNKPTGFAAGNEVQVQPPSNERSR